MDISGTFSGCRVAEPFAKPAPSLQQAGNRQGGRLSARQLRNGLLGFLILCCSANSLAAESRSPDSRLLGLGISINDPANAVGLAKIVGANAIRTDAPWKQIEPSAGQYVIPDWLERNVNSMVNAGLTPLLILAYGNPLYDAGDKPTSRPGIEAFARYAAFVVKHFKGRVMHYDLWNEWDAHTGRTTPLGADEYVNLARTVYPAIKAVDRKVQILSGGISDKGMREGFFEKFFQLGGHKFIDGLSIHPYVWNSRKRKTPEGAMDFVDQVASLARRANGGTDMPVYLTEIGWPTHTGKDALTEDEASWYLTRYFVLAASRDYVRGIFWYCLMDQGADPNNKEHRFGVLDRQQEARSAAKAFKKVSGLLSGDARVKIRQEKNLSVAEIYRSGKLNGRVSWSEQARPGGLGDMLGSSIREEKHRSEDLRAPRWQAAGAEGP